MPLNLFGDFGGGALYLALGIACGIIEARQSGHGQVVDAAMTDGCASLMTMFYGMMANGSWNDARGSNAVDGGSHFYTVYETSDGKYVSIGSIEAKFYAELLERTGLADRDLTGPIRHRAMARRTVLADVFKTKTRDDGATSWRARTFVSRRSCP